MFDWKVKFNPTLKSHLKEEKTLEGRSTLLTDLLQSHFVFFFNIKYTRFIYFEVLNISICTVFLLIFLLFRYWCVIVSVFTVYVLSYPCLCFLGWFHIAYYVILSSNTSLVILFASTRMPSFGVRVKSTQEKTYTDGNPGAALSNLSSDMSLDGWDGVALEYYIDWPLQLFFTQEVLSK